MEAEIDSAEQPEAIETQVAEEDARPVSSSVKLHFKPKNTLKKPTIKETTSVPARFVRKQPRKYADVKSRLPERTLLIKARKPQTSAQQIEDEEVSVSAGQQRLVESLVKKCRQTGQLNLSGKKLTAVPRIVYRCQERPKDDSESDKDSRSSWCFNSDQSSRNSSHRLKNMIDLSKSSSEEPDDAWWTWHKLQRLTLSNNTIVKIHQDIGLLTNLVVLDLSHNNIQKLPSEIGQLEMLEKFLISYNDLVELPESIGRLIRLLHLQVDHNRLQKLPDSISLLSSMEHADFSHNELTCLPDSSLNGWHVVNLNLSHNKIADFGQGEIGWLQSLQVFDLSHNNLGPLSPSEVGELRKLEWLSLHNNQLEGIPILEYCYCLKELHAGANQIVGLCDDWFEYVPTLRVADFHNNQIQRLPRSVMRLAGLERINLDKNLLESLPPEVALIPTLKSISLKDNPIRTIRRDIVMRGGQDLLRHLRTQCAGNEPISDQDQTAVDLSFSSSRNTDQVPKKPAVPSVRDAIRSKTFDMRCQRLTRLDESLVEPLKNEDINHVDLSDNLLTDIPDSLSPLATEITEIRLTKNRIENLSNNVQIFKRLRILDLSVNRLSQLPDCLSELRETLDELNLANNIFTQVPTVVYSLSSLTELLLDGNKLTAIDHEGLKKLELLETLNLSMNDISYVPPELGLMTHLKCLKLDCNAFKIPRASTLAKGTDEILRYLRSRLPVSTEGNI